MRYLISMSYNGSKYYGFQRLPKEKTVQGELEKALTKINKKRVYVKGAGRTDRGVHAINQKAHFDLDISISPNHLVKAINSLVGPYIKVNEVWIVKSDFHARYKAEYKIYSYVINMGESDPLMEDYMYNLGHELNIRKMKRASRLLEGYHSYIAFTSGFRRNYDSVIYKIKFSREGNILTITFVGKSFYRYMVRNLVGVLIGVGEGKFDTYDIIAMLENDYRVSYMTAPSCGLYLDDVVY